LQAELPSGAILENCFLISAEKCLTFLNERPDDFPDWVNPLWHNCLIGCMKCQYSCPVNKKFKNCFEGEIYFTEDETQQIINETPFDKLNTITMDKLTCLNLQNDHKLLPRNLRALILKEENND
jgi:epoxyqueuosine reductase